jgi:hypothetical protein
MNVSEFKAELKLAFAIEMRFRDLLQLECGVIGYSMANSVIVHIRLWLVIV